MGDGACLPFFFPDNDDSGQESSLAHGMRKDGGKRPKSRMVMPRVRDAGRRGIQMNKRSFASRICCAVRLKAHAYERVSEIPCFKPTPEWDYWSVGGLPWSVAVKEEPGKQESGQNRARGADRARLIALEALLCWRLEDYYFKVE